MSEDSTKNDGPALSLKASCFNCSYERSTRYRAQGDSGSDVECAHPVANAQGHKSVGDTTWDTPQWCPLLSGAVAAMASRLAGGVR